MKSNHAAFLKKIFLLFIATVICVSCLAGCGGIFSDDGNESGKDKANNAVSGSTAVANVTPSWTEIPSPTNGNSANPTHKPYEKSIKITYLDVGQGDSAFVEFPNGKTMLIDASESKASDDIISFISRQGYTKIDYLIATHPHADHIGGMKDVIETFDVGEIYMPKASTNTKTYEKLLMAIADKGKKIKAASAGMSICDGVDILAPNSAKYEEMNNYSVVIKITYGNNKFLFMGDAETLSENEILNAGFDVSADVIKVGHHGSGTSSGAKFVKATGAKYAVISVGEGNSYNHPHTFIVDRWQSTGATIYRTDLSGNISVTSNGVNIDIMTEK